MAIPNAELPALRLKAIRGKYPHRLNVNPPVHKGGCNIIMSFSGAHPAVSLVKYEGMPIRLIIDGHAHFEISAFSDPKYPNVHFQITLMKTKEPRALIEGKPFIVDVIRHKTKERIPAFAITLEKGHVFRFECLREGTGANIHVEQKEEENKTPAVNPEVVENSARNLIQIMVLGLLKGDKKSIKWPFKPSETVTVEAFPAYMAVDSGEIFSPLDERDLQKKYYELELYLVHDPANVEVLEGDFVAKNVPEKHAKILKQVKELFNKDWQSQNKSPKTA